MTMQTVTADETRIFYEGPEQCREYFDTGKITFGTSTLEPGETGAIDPGHPESHEVFFVCQGTVRLRNPDDGQTYDLVEGQAILIPEGAPHELTNIGQVRALVSWSAAPSPR
jgi:mannose-6-phosphate isomerase-like protein (cupin superfamily)